jgi:hypothetical protein
MSHEQRSPPREQAKGRSAVTDTELAIDEINREFPDIEAFTHNGMCYARLAGIVVIAAAPGTGELREQIQDYFGSAARRQLPAPGGAYGKQTARYR